MKLFLVLLIIIFLKGASLIPTRNAASQNIAKFVEERIHSDSIKNDPEYHHEQLLGSEQADLHDELSSSDAKDSLSRLVLKIDEDKNGFVSEEELTEWIAHVNRRLVFEETDRFWQHFKRDSPTLQDLDFNTHVKSNYGAKVLRDESFLDELAHGTTSTIRQNIEWDRKRWDFADQNRDGKLNFNEYQAFVHPDDFAHMHEIVIESAIRDLDGNNDGKIDLNEFLNEMLRGDDYKNDEEELKLQKEHIVNEFRESKDSDKSGYLEFPEVKEWILPDGYHHSQAEAAYLVGSADKDGDGVLSTAEIVDNYNLFVGSAATEFGRALGANVHDEF